MVVAEQRTHLAHRCLDNGEEIHRLELELETERFETRRLQHVGDEPGHLLCLLGDPGQGRRPIRFREHPLTQHGCVAPDDPQRAAQLMGGDVEKVAFETFEPAAALGLLLEVVNRRRLADPESHETGEPEPDVALVISDALPTAEEQQPHDLGSGRDRDHDLSGGFGDFAGRDRPLEAGVICEAVDLATVRIARSRRRHAGQEIAAEDQQ